MNIPVLAAASTLLVAAVAAPAAADRRFPPLEPAAMSPEQKAI